ncbi:MAG: NAD-dependent epimerase/dehydratase family protein [Spirochaetaceae bacterium]
MSKNIIIGTGPLGLAVMDELIKQGQNVTLVNRSGKVNEKLPKSVNLIKADVTNSSDVRQICKDVTVVYICAQPLYTNWVEGFPPIISGIINGLTGSDIRVVFADNLYMYGSTNGEPIKEDLPHLAISKKGKLRSQIANKLLESDLDVKLLRGSDFFGPRVRNSGFGDVVFKAVTEKKPVNLFGKPNLLHSITYIRDFAKGLVLLGESFKVKESVFHLPNIQNTTPNQFVDLIGAELNRKLKVMAAGKLMVSILGLFIPMVKEVKEIMYQWNEPFIVDHSLFIKNFNFSPTPYKNSIKETLDWFKNESEKGKL